MADQQINIDIVTRLDKLDKDMTQAQGKVNKATDGMSKGFQRMSGAVDTSNRGFKMMGSQLTSLTSGMGGATGVAGQFVSSLLSMGPAIGTVVAVGTTLIGVLKDIFTSLQNIAEAQKSIQSFEFLTTTMQEAAVKGAMTKVTTEYYAEGKRSLVGRLSGIESAKPYLEKAQAAMQSGNLPAYRNALIDIRNAIAAYQIKLDFLNMSSATFLPWLEAAINNVDAAMFMQGSRGMMTGAAGGVQTEDINDAYAKSLDVKSGGLSNVQKLKIDQIDAYLKEISDTWNEHLPEYLAPLDKLMTYTPEEEVAYKERLKLSSIINPETWVKDIGAFGNKALSTFNEAFGEPLKQLFEDTFGTFKMEIKESDTAFAKFGKSLINNLIDMIGQFLIQGLAFAAIITALNLIPPPGTIGTAFAKILAGGLGKGGGAMSMFGAGYLNKRGIDYDNPLNDAWAMKQGGDFYHHFMRGMNSRMNPRIGGLGERPLVVIQANGDWMRWTELEPEASQVGMGKRIRELKAKSERTEI